MNFKSQEIKIYYDQEVNGKLNGFIEVNQRVEKAWETLIEWSPKWPTRILEIGCGIGNISWRLSRHWPRSYVYGIDISPKSIYIAERLFEAKNLTFLEHDVSENSFPDEEFDLIVLIDVYEHIAKDSRPDFHYKLKKAITPNSRLFLSCPTPRKQYNLRQFHPDSIQPVDENIDLPTIQTLAKDLGLEILMYKEVNVWNIGDYLHAVLGLHSEWKPAISDSLINKISRKIGKTINFFPKLLKLQRIQNRLGRDFYS